MSVTGNPCPLLGQLDLGKEPRVRQLRGQLAMPGPRGEGQKAQSHGQEVDGLGNINPVPEQAGVRQG